MATKGKILVVLTSYGPIVEGTTSIASGFYLPELAHPYEILSPKYEFVVASPRGGTSPLDVHSVGDYVKDPACIKVLSSGLWHNTIPLGQFLGRSGEFDAIFYPGGSGPMYDLAENTESQQLIREFWEAGKVVATVCHGSAALVNVTLANGKNILEGQGSITGFSNGEENAIQLMEYMPFSLQDALNEKSGGNYVEASELWHPKITARGNLITGQNPASASGVAQEILKALDSKV